MSKEYEYRLALIRISRWMKGDSRVITEIKDNQPCRKYPHGTDVIQRYIKDVLK